MAELTPTSHALFIPEVWAKEAQLARRNNLVAANLVNRQYESDLSFGDTVHVPFVANMTADTVTPGTDLTAVAPSETEVQIVVNTMKGKAVTLHDWTKKQSKYDLAKIYGGQIGFALAKAIDTAVLAEIASGSTNTRVDCTTGATYANIVAAVQALDAADVPQEDRAFIVNAKFMGDLRKLAEFTRYDAAGIKNPSVASSPSGNMVGSIYGIPVYMSNNIQVEAGTPAHDLNLLVHKDAVGLVVQKDVAFETDRRSLALATDVVGSCLFGVKTLRGDHSVILQRQ